MKPFQRKPGSFLPPSELPINPDGSIYHLALRADQLADSVIVVGDPARVRLISSQFDRIEHKIENREFHTHTGTYRGKRITALSTGIGTDNIDIVMNELDALRSIDFETRKIKNEFKPLDIVRLGTSGGLNSELTPGSFVCSTYALGLDGVLHFYDLPFEEDETELAREFASHVHWSVAGIRPYAVRADEKLGKKFREGFQSGITVTACGFYGPQGRKLRLPLALPDLNVKMADFEFRGIPIANYEMESSALFGLGSALGHECTTVCLVVANRVRNEFLADHHKAMEELISLVLERFTAD